MNDIVQKGEVSEKKSNFECMNISDILLREGGGAKLMSFFKDVFSSHHLPIFQHIHCFLSIFDIINNFIIDF